MAGIYSLILSIALMERGDFFTAIIFSCFVIAFAIAMFLAKDEVPKKTVDLGYEKIIACVDTNIVTDEQLMKNYEIISKNGEIYELREKEPDKIKTSENVHGEQLHNWSVIEKRDKEDTVEYVLQCSECNQEKIIVRQKETN